MFLPKHPSLKLLMGIEPRFPSLEEAAWHGDPATTKQINYLVALIAGLPEAHRHTFFKEFGGVHPSHSKPQLKAALSGLTKGGAGERIDFVKKLKETPTSSPAPAEPAYESPDPKDIALATELLLKIHPGAAVDVLKNKGIPKPIIDEKHVSVAVGMLSASDVKSLIDYVQKKVLPHESKATSDQVGRILELLYHLGHDVWHSLPTSKVQKIHSSDLRKLTHYEAEELIKLLQVEVHKHSTPEKEKQIASILGL